MSQRHDENLLEWTEEELALLRSADGDRPGPRSLAAALAAVGAGGAIASSAAAAHGAVATTAAVAGSNAKWAGVITLSKWMAVVLVGSTIATGGVMLSRRAESTEKPATRTAHALAASARAAVPERRDVPPEPAVPAQAPTAQSEADPAPLAATADPVAPRVQAPKRATPSQPDIRLELAAIDAAMKTLRAGHAAEALAALDRYDAKFAATGSLQVEATALRIEALMRAGQRARASELAAAFLATHPRSPYAPRVRSLAASAANDAANPTR